MRTEWRYPSDRPSYEVVVSCMASGGTDAERNTALAEVTKLLTPAPSREIEGWLAELSVLVARRQQDEIDEAVRLTAYASRLGAYPADVARAALLDHRWKFWPTWDELSAVCDGLASRRRQMVAALAAPPASAATEREAIDREQRARIVAGAATAAGFIRNEHGGWTLPEEAKARARVPHWSETAGPNDPRWSELRRARARSAEWDRV